MPKNNSLACWPSRPAVVAKVKSLAGPSSELALAIAELAEPGMAEVQSSRLLARFLADNGFAVTWPYKDMPTAFRAVCGAGRPTIALLAEYDALPDCGPRPGQWGHGCGHNLLGVASALAGVAAVAALAKTGKQGKIVVIGCPAEEALGGKVFMARQRAFDGLDAVLTWHPSGGNSVNQAGGSAMDSLLFRFTGRTAHAAGGPDQGRSALDAALLTDVAVNYLREHVPENSRIHSVITDGGVVPNVVPDRSEIWYFIRGKDRAQVDQLRRRMLLCARGAALATETTVKLSVPTAITERIVNRTISDMLDRFFRRCGGPQFDARDARLARPTVPGKKYNSNVEPLRLNQGRASSDEDNVSWFAPLGCVCVACVPGGTPAHHRSYAALVRTPAALKGMWKAAELLALGAVELTVNRSLLKKATAEFQKNRRGKKYDLPITAKRLEPIYGRRG